MPLVGRSWGTPSRVRKKLIAMAEFAMNNSKNCSTQETPFYLNYSRHPKSPLALGVEIWKPLKGYDNPNAHGLAMAIDRAQHLKSGHLGNVLRQNIPVVTQFDNCVQAALKEAKECLERAQQHESKHADKHRRYVTFEKEG